MDNLQSNLVFSPAEFSNVYRRQERLEADYFASPILGGFIFFSLVIILVLELLYSKSVEYGDMNDGGVAFATDSNTFSVLTTFR
jgi:hypothetical protein